MKYLLAKFKRSENSYTIESLGDLHDKITIVTITVRYDIYKSQILLLLLDPTCNTSLCREIRNNYKQVDKGTRIDKNNFGIGIPSNFRVSYKTLQEKTGSQFGTFYKVGRYDDTFDVVQWWQNRLRLDK